jgi:HAE1 family hydrophobic/amphiphilic exporter-1
MDIIKFSIQKPVTTVVIVILIMLFGFLSINKLAYQLTPNVNKPEITIRTVWPSASPYDVEREIIDEQEDALKGISGLKDIESTAYNGMAEVSLEFELGTDINDAMLLVSNKLDTVRSYPDNVEKPVINASGASSSPVIWTVLQSLDGNPRTANYYLTFFENEVRQYLERVKGVSDLLVFGGVKEELHVLVDTDKMASYGLTYDNILSTIGSENVNTSAGLMGVGRKNYRIRTTGEFTSPAEVENMVIKSDGQVRVLVSDIATVERSYAKIDSAMFYNSVRGMVVGVRPEATANVLEMTESYEKVVQKLNDTILKDNGLKIQWMYDQRPYIQGSIDLVKRNILIGSVLAVIVLLLFLRSVTSTVVVATAIPISIIGTFIFLKALDRSLNVISLAGISFAVGMLVDNAIVVLENIDRHRGLGKSAFNAAYDGAKEVWGAVFASTATTVAVFLPVVFMQEEAGQLFKDIAIAITASVMISLFVSVSVIPAFIYQLLKIKERKAKNKKTPPLGFVDKFGRSVSSAVLGLLDICTKSVMSRVVTIVLLVGFSLGMAYVLFPPREYLPQGNRNLLLSIFVPPPGLSVEERGEIGRNLFESTDKYRTPQNGLPAIKDMFYVGAERIMIAGIVSSEDQRARELLPLLNKEVNSIPGVFGVTVQTSIFESGIGKGRSVDVNVSGSDINQIAAGAGMMYGMLAQSIPGAQIRPVPSLEVSYPEVNFVPDRDRLKSVGMTTESLGKAVDIIMDGRKASEYKEPGKKKIDLVVKNQASDSLSPEDIGNSLIATAKGGIVPLNTLAQTVPSSGIQQIRHYELDRTITLQVTPPATTPIETAMNVINNDVAPALLSNPAFKDLKINMSGTADKLTQAISSLKWNFVLAAFITYLLMAALFGNFIYPLIIIFTVPLAAAGGVIGLKLINVFMVLQPMDILTMLGFIILVGTVVNNAILIVHQTLNNIREQGMDYKEAVMDSAKTRLRPIYMSATTSLFGMLPLVLSPGAGSELYRGLGGVVLGGLALSTVFTVFLIPSMLMFVIKLEKKRGVHE